MKKLKLFTGLLIIPFLFSCESLVNSLAFFPDTDFSLGRDKLPAFIEPLYLATEDGIKLEVLYFHHKKRTDKFVIYFHGNAGNLYHRIKEATVIYNMGYDLVISGYRGYGESSGEPTEEGIYKDGGCVLNYAMNTLDYSPGKIYIYGRSLGTTVAVHIAQNITLGGVILITPLSSAENFIEEKFPGIFTSLGKNHFQSIEKIKNLRSPILIIHGTDDEVIPYVLGVKLYDAYSGKKEFVAIKGGGHNNLEFVDGDLYWQSVESFLAR